MKVDEILGVLRAEGYEVDDKILQTGVHLDWPTIKRAMDHWEVVKQQSSNAEATSSSLYESLAVSEKLVRKAKSQVDKLEAKLTELQLFIADAYAAVPDIEILIKRKKEKRRYVKRS